MNPWKVLGVQRSAPPEVVQAAYRALAKTWHPDKHAGKDSEPEAKRRMAEINQALQMIEKGEGGKRDGSFTMDDLQEAIEIGEKVGEAGGALLNFVKKLRGK